MDERETLEYFIRKLASRPQILRVVLFGSRARGEARGDSDFDLCVIVDEMPDVHQFYIELMRELASAEWSLDLMILTQAQYAARLEEGWSVITAIANDGKTLYAA